ncbi:hypothetical protein JD276_11245 [Leucobacter sp. CSA1]|uniref:CN hydrolase domain-containing protein n=1 Tax=Leucobacter chromiisoli TaxID=2796471 RepID=A0A934Q8U4_9MICO|nr:nitrilase-related carbon-nitrogen hydrolase [Leucobacter chromiisoli]MBK0419608.1 hypothetical protein [Leucobacter chromiisoli]
MPTQVTVAAVQTIPVIGDTAHNLADMLARADEAARRGARLIVFPELATSGYVFSDADEARDCAGALVSLDAAGRFRELCARHGAVAVFGYPEIDDDRLYNSAMVVGPEGVVGNYRKNHLWNLENEIFTPGDTGYPVFDTLVGRVGILICYDIWFPEAVRSLVLGEADVICLPTNWVPIEGAPHGRLTMANLLCQTNSHINGITIVGADRAGVERGQEFLGKSVISSPSGELAAGPASDTEAETLYAAFDGAEGRRARHWNDYNDPVENRRPETYRLQ